MMNIGFETIGNATLIFHDKVPVLVTDPWLSGDAYFGSWVLPYEIPEEQKRSIEACKYVWFSHGHPDHLNGADLPRFKGKKILLADHFGSRIRKSLEQDGHDVVVLPDRKWTAISDRIKIMSIADYNQDGVLLADVDGRLVFNMNDANDCGWGRFVKKILKEYPISFLLKGFGEADMCNFFGEDGQQMKSVQPKNVGSHIANLVDGFGAKNYIPFSASHAYQRTDSAWTNERVSEFSSYSEGYSSASSRILPAFISYDCSTDKYTEINPRKVAVELLPPERFGDNWGDPLEAGEFAKAEKYFKAFEHLGEFMDFINLKVGGKDNQITLVKDRFKRGVTFEVPRHSLMQAIEWEVFDDLLIGNFMKSTLHGKWPITNLYPDFTPYVGKYGDNGYARTNTEVNAYFKEYRERNPIDFFMHRMEKGSKNIFRKYVSLDSKVYQYTKKVYWSLQK